MESALWFPETLVPLVAPGLGVERWPHGNLRSPLGLVPTVLLQNYCLHFPHAQLFSKQLLPAPPPALHLPFPGQATNFPSLSGFFSSQLSV